MNDLLVFLEKLPNYIAVIWENDTMQNFENQSFDGQKWAGRKQQSSKNRALLVQTGSLKQSLTFETSSNKVTAFSDLPYAKIHNEGGIIEQTPTFKQRMYFSHLSGIASSTAEKNKWAKMSLAKKLVIPIPKRQFLGFSKSFESSLQDFLNQKLNELSQ